MERSSKIQVLLLVAATCGLMGCGGSAFSTIEAPPPYGDDGGVEAASADPPDSGSGLLDHRTAYPEASQDGGADSDAARLPDGGVGEFDALVDAPSVDAPTDASDSCANDLSNVRGDFHIDFDVLGTAGGGPLIEQRSDCNQYSVHWLVAETASANLITQFYDGSGGPQLQSVATINDGAWHHVVVARVAGTLSITIDGHLDSSSPNAVWSPPALPLLQVGRSACATTFAGQVKNACVARQ